MIAPRLDFSDVEFLSDVGGKIFELNFLAADGVFLACDIFSKWVGSNGDAFSRLLGEFEIGPGGFRCSGKCWLGLGGDDGGQQSSASEGGESVCQETPSRIMVQSRASLADSNMYRYAIRGVTGTKRGDRVQKGANTNRAEQSKAYSEWAARSGEIRCDEKSFQRRRIADADADELGGGVARLVSNRGRRRRQRGSPDANEQRDVSFYGICDCTYQNAEWGIAAEYGEPVSGFR